MTADQFIDFLNRHCREKMTFNPAFFDREHGRDEAYNDVINLINLWRKKYESDAA